MVTRKFVKSETPVISITLWNKCFSPKHIGNR